MNLEYCLKTCILFGDLHRLLTLTCSYFVDTVMDALPLCALCYTPAQSGSVLDSTMAFDLSR